MNSIRTVREYEIITVGRSAVAEVTAAGALLQVADCLPPAKVANRFDFTTNYL